MPRFRPGMAIALLILTACGAAAQSEADRDVLAAAENVLGWDLPDNEWLDLARSACVNGAWDSERAIALAQQFIDEHVDEYMAAPSDEVAALVFQFATIRCRERIPAGAVPPHSVTLRPRGT